MLKYFTKALLFLLIIIISLFLVATAVLNAFLLKSKKSIIQKLCESSSLKISLKDITYLPPNFLILNNAALMESFAPAGKEVIAIPRIFIAFSIREFIKKNGLSVSYVYLHKPKADYRQLSSFLKVNAEQIITFLYNIPKVDSVKLKANEILLDVAKVGSVPNFLSAGLTLIVNRNSVYSWGSLSMADNLILSKPFHYNFKGDFKKAGISIDNLEIVRDNFYAKLWGSAEKKDFSLKGFAFVSDFFKKDNSEKPVVKTAIGKIKTLLLEKGRKRGLSSIVEVSRDDLNILDIDFQANFGFPDIRIDRFNFSLNNVPLSLKGNILFKNPVLLNIFLTAYPSLGKAPLDSKKMDLKIAGVLKNKIFSGRVDFDFLRKQKDVFRFERVKVLFEKLSFCFNDLLHPKMQFHSGNLFYFTSDKTYRLLLKDFNAALRLQEGRFKFIEFSSLLYDGFLKGQGRIDTIKQPYRATFNANVKETNANNLKGIIPQFSKVYGKLNSQMFCSNYPQLALRGSMSMQSGYLEKFDFFNWVSDFFMLPSLKKIDFRGLSFGFFVNPQESRLNDISLNSDNVNLNGYYSVREDDMVSSKIFLNLTKSMLKESRKFIPLINIVGRDAESFNFDFQISGLFNAMNFKWLESDFKSKLQNSIPGFIERKIERKIEEAIESISQ